MALATTVLAASAATNPFFEYKNWKTPHGTYPFNEIYAEHYMPAFEEAMKRGLQEIDEIVNNPAAPTFANTIEAYEASGEMLSIVAGCFYNLTSAETNDSLQQIEIELSPKMSEYSATIRLNEGLFKRIKAVYDQKDKLKLNKAQVKLLEDIYDSFANNGANLSAEDKQTYRELSAKLSKLTLQYGQNVLKATNAWTMLITDEALLAGLNEDTKNILKENAAKKGVEGWMLNLKPTTYIPVMQDLDNRDIRRELYTAYNTRCIGGEYDNTALIVEIVNTRLALANLFGKKNYAEKALYNRMAETPENVYSLLNQLRDAYTPAAKAEAQELQEYATAHGLYATLQAWDWTYYSKKLKQEKYSISDDDLRPYFELENVKKGVFGLAERLFGIKFKENKNIQVYHPEVTAYEVFDEKGKFLAVYYTDFHPREGKRGGAWMNDFQPQYKVGKKDHRPHIINVMNFTRATADKPALFTYDEVRTFLHEFGHGLHGMLTRCQYASQSGTNVPRDFVELPSQFNENFLDEKEFLDTFAKHYKTGETMPAELIEKLGEERIDEELKLERMIALELERIAMHIADTGALCTDVGYQLGQVACEALRTVTINTTQAWCGNRFGKGLIRPCGSNKPLTQEKIEMIRANVAEVRRRYAEVVEDIKSSPSLLYFQCAAIPLSATSFIFSLRICTSIHLPSGPIAVRWRAR